MATKVTKPIPKKKTTPTKKVATRNTAKIATKTTEKIKPIVTEVLNPAIYPIGKHIEPTAYTKEINKKNEKSIHNFPKKLKKLAKKIKNGKQLQSSYREGGWSIEQIIHHLADSHMNAFIRFKMALTENNPTIKPYDQDLWSETSDIQIPIKSSIQLIKYIHEKWSSLIKNMDEHDFKRTYYHPGYNTTNPLQSVISIYAWHGNHHLAQIEVALQNADNKSKKEKKKKEKDIKNNKKSK